MKVCSVNGCGGTVKALGLCRWHYSYAHNHGVISKFSHLAELPSVIPVGWSPPGGPLPFSQTLLEQRRNAAAIDAARDARDLERFDISLTPSGLVVREREAVAA